MARSRRESHHSDGITDQKSLQRTSATKSAQSGHDADLDAVSLARLSGVCIEKGRDAGLLIVTALL
jgi:hypothetical protein